VQPSRPSLLFVDAGLALEVPTSRQGPHALQQAELKIITKIQHPLDSTDAGNWKPAGEGGCASGLVLIFSLHQAPPCRPVPGALLLADAFGSLSAALPHDPSALLAPQCDCSGLGDPSITQTWPRSALQSSAVGSERRSNHHLPAPPFLSTGDTALTM